MTADAPHPVSPPHGLDLHAARLEAACVLARAGFDPETVRTLLYSRDPAPGPPADPADEWDAA